MTGRYACQIEGTSFDVLAVNGNLNLSGSNLALAPTGAGATQTCYRIATWTGTRTAAFGTVTGLPSGYNVVHDDTLREVRLDPAPGYTAWESARGITGGGPASTPTV